MSLKIYFIPKGYWHILFLSTFSDIKQRLLMKLSDYRNWCNERKQNIQNKCPMLSSVNNLRLKNSYKKK